MKTATPRPHGRYGCLIALTVLSACHNASAQSTIIQSPARPDPFRITQRGSSDYAPAIKGQQPSTDRWHSNLQWDNLEHEGRHLSVLINVGIGLADEPSASTSPTLRIPTTPSTHSQPRLEAVSCGAGWTDRLFSGGPPAGTVRAIAEFDDGSGKALYVAGDFQTIGGVDANRIAKWDGTTWTPLGTGLNNTVLALTVFDDGTGPALYAGGAFTTAGGASANRIARWDGTSWSPLGVGLNNTVEDLAVYDIGSGPALYAGGRFTTAGGISASRIARWSGSSWTNLGVGVNEAVFAIQGHDDGTGPALYVGGQFSNAGGISASWAAKWNGSTWSSLPGLFGVVLGLTVFDDGGGSAIYASGGFSTQFFPNSRVAKWTGTTWIPVGVFNTSLPEVVHDLATFDNGSGSALYATGDFTSAGLGIVRLDGDSWSNLGDGIYGGGYALGTYDVPPTTSLIVGGDFHWAYDDLEKANLARWDGSSWSPLSNGLSGAAYTATVFDDGDGPSLYVGGALNWAGPLRAANVAQWDGTNWSSLGAGCDNWVHSMATFDDGSGNSLYVGGEFEYAGGVYTPGVARWDGTTWHSAGNGLAAGEFYPILALRAFDDGSGPALFAGGYFGTATGPNVAKWNGTEWAALGGGMNGAVASLAVYDDGTGPALFAGGWFTLAGTTAATRIAKWDGVTWLPLGAGIGPNDPTTSVQSLQVFDDGNGPALYAGGRFQTAGGSNARNIARWDGTSWSPVGVGLGTDGSGSVKSLAVFDDGSGLTLYAGGSFRVSGAVSVNGIARLEGSNWAPLGTGVGPGLFGYQEVNSLAAYGAGPGALFATGTFLGAGGIGAHNIARWGCPADIAPIPAISQWGLGCMTLLVLCAGTVVLRRSAPCDRTVVQSRGHIGFIANAACCRSIVGKKIHERQHSATGSAVRLQAVCSARTKAVTALLLLIVPANGATMAQEYQEDAKLTALDADAGVAFGFSLAVTGQTIVVAAPGEACATGINCGATYVYELVSDSWVQQAKLTASDAEQNDSFTNQTGFSNNAVSISGNTIVVGAHGDDCAAGANCGSAYVFVKPAGGWTDMAQTAKLTASDAQDFNEFGRSVSISGDVIVVGAPLADLSLRGAAYIFEKPVGGWIDTTETAKLTASDAMNFDQLGYSAASTTDTIVIGAYNPACEGAVCRPAAYVFEKPITGWTDTVQTAKLTAGFSLQGPGSSVSISSTGQIIVAGAMRDSGYQDSACPAPGQSCGSAYVYVRPTGGWTDTTEDAKLTGSDTVAGDYFGRSVSTSGDTIVVGAAVLGGGIDRGSGYLFQRPVAGWGDMTETARLLPSDAADGDLFGTSVSIAGATIVVGSPQDDCGAGNDCGSAYVFATPGTSIPAVSTWGLMVSAVALLAAATGILRTRPLRYSHPGLTTRP